MGNFRTFSGSVLSFFCSVWLLAAAPVAEIQAAEPEPVTLTLLHTNDLHSHFRPDKSPLGLGGVARLKTQVQKIRSENPDALLVDAGDWSEGSIYFAHQKGASILKMMDEIGYDAAVIGNHDWLNGPDVLLSLLTENPTHTRFISSNIKGEGYSRWKEFKEQVPDTFIREIQGVKVAFIGISTWEFVYNRFLLPLQVFEPFQSVHDLAKKLKTTGQADVVIALSHNRVLVNKAILKWSPYIDLVVGGHDHVKLDEPARVSHFPMGSGQGWVVEAGYWGQYLGRMDLKVYPNKTVELANYQLIPMSAAIPDDPGVVSRVESIESDLEGQFGQPLFHDQVGVSQMELPHKGLDNIGNLVTDAYQDLFHTDLSINSYKFIYGELHIGPLSSADVFDLDPAVYQVETGKTWTVKILPISGRFLKWFFQSVFAGQNFSSMGLVSVAGMHFTIDPWFQPSEYRSYDPRRFFEGFWGVLESSTFSGVGDMTVQGEAIDPEKMYRVALSDGVIEGIRFLNSHVQEVLSLKDLEDTGQDSWRVLSRYIRKISPISPDKLLLGNRIQTKGPNLGIFSHDLTWTPFEANSHGVLANVKVHVQNYGAAASDSGRGASRMLSGDVKVRLVLRKNDSDAEEIELGAPQSVATLNPGESQVLVWQNVLIPESGSLFPVTAEIQGVESQIERDHTVATRSFSFQ